MAMVKKRMVVVACLVAALVAAATANAADMSNCTEPEVAIAKCAEEFRRNTTLPLLGHQPILTPECCNRLAKKMPCGCQLRKEFLKIAPQDLDPNKAFCFDGTGCTKPNA